MLCKHNVLLLVKSKNNGYILHPQDQEFNMRMVPTLAGDVEQSQEPESLHLHLSMSHPSESSSAYQVSRDTDYWFPP